MFQFFKRGSDGSILFTERSKKHPNEKIEDVALSDPGYLRWARSKNTVGVEIAIFEAIEAVMTKYSVSFTEPGKKGRKRKKKKP